MIIIDQEKGQKNRRTDPPGATIWRNKGSHDPWYLGVIIVLGCAALTVTVSSLQTTPTRRDLVWSAVLLVLGVAQTEISKRTERERRAITTFAHIDVNTVWCVAGSALLSPGWAALLVTAIYVHLWFRIWRPAQETTLDRMGGTIAIIALAAWSASSLLHHFWGSALAARGVHSVTAQVALAAIVFDVLNALGVALAVYLRTRTRSLSNLFGSWSDNALEVVTLSLGVITAVLLDSPQPYTVLLVYAPLLILNRASLFQQLKARSVTDAKTGVLNSGGWDEAAAGALSRVLHGHHSAVLMIDVDHFKRVNDTYGHLAGDDVLRELANTITDSVRKNDVVGRYGGEEFVVLLPDVDEDDAVGVGERIRHATQQISIPIVDDNGPGVIEQLSVSIGLARYPDDSRTLAGLLDAADRALYRAKEAGRNRLVLWQEDS